jgi:predicted nucleic acid-binding protein
MIVVADTSPLNYLVLIGEIDLLPKLYAEVVIPPAVRDELTSAQAPPSVREWIEHTPPWLKIVAPRTSRDTRLAMLDLGEREALAVALEIRADLVLVDDRDARLVAEECGLNVAGTLRVLVSAADKGILNLANSFARLRTTSFRVNPALMTALLNRRTGM